MLLSGDILPGQDRTPPYKGVRCPVSARRMHEVGKALPKIEQQQHRTRSFITKRSSRSQTAPTTIEHRANSTGISTSRDTERLKEKSDRSRNGFLARSIDARPSRQRRSTPIREHDQQQHSTIAPLCGVWRMKCPRNNARNACKCGPCGDGCAITYGTNLQVGSALSAQAPARPQDREAWLQFEKRHSPRASHPCVISAFVLLDANSPRRRTSDALLQTDGRPPSIVVRTRPHRRGREKRAMLLGIRVLQSTNYKNFDASISFRIFFHQTSMATSACVACDFGDGVYSRP
jgi:hypothetical protein